MGVFKYLFMLKWSAGVVGRRIIISLKILRMSNRDGMGG